MKFVLSCCCVRKKENQVLQICLGTSHEIYQSYCLSSQIEHVPVLGDSLSGSNSLFCLFHLHRKRNMHFSIRPSFNTTYTF